MKPTVYVEHGITKTCLMLAIRSQLSSRKEDFSFLDNSEGMSYKNFLRHIQAYVDLRWEEL